MITSWLLVVMISSSPVTLEVVDDYETEYKCESAKKRLKRKDSACMPILHEGI